MKDKKLREDLKIEKLNNDLWKIPSEHPMKDWMKDLYEKISHNEKEIKELKREIDISGEQKYTIGWQVGWNHGLMMRLLEHLGLEIYSTWEEDRSYLPPRPKMKKVWRIKKIGKKDNNSQ